MRYMYDRELLISAGGAFLKLGFGLDLATACQITIDDLIPLFENWLARQKFEKNSKNEVR